MISLMTFDDNDKKSQALKFPKIHRVLHIYVIVIVLMGINHYTKNFINKIFICINRKIKQLNALAKSKANLYI